MDLGNATNTIEVLKKYNYIFKKKFGQNFLIDANVLNKITDAAEVGPEDVVLEIGPGIGTMTGYLARRAKKVIAVEIDETLIPILEDTLSEFDNVSVINEDILKVDIAELVEKENGGKPIKVVANLPYYITTPIIMGLFEKEVPLHSITVMVQKEVADRMCEGPGTKDYGALSLAVQFYSEPSVITVVSPHCFIPQPNVSSSVINMKVYEKPPICPADKKLMFAIIRAAFNQRRKTLVNGISNAPDLHIPKEKVMEALEKMGKSPTVRGETFTLEEFAMFSDLVK